MKIFIRSLLIMGFCLLVSSSAYAIDTSSNTPNLNIQAVIGQAKAGSLSVSVASQGLNGNTALGMLMPQGKENAISSANRAWLLCLLSIAAYLLGFHTLDALVHIAENGKFFGNKYTVFAPIKVIICGMCLYPSYYGFCYAQVAVVKVGFAGNYVGDQVWGAFTDTMIKGVSTNGQPNSGSQQFIQLPVGGMDVAINVLKLETCVALANAYNFNGYEKFNAVAGDTPTEGTGPNVNLATHIKRKTLPPQVDGQQEEQRSLMSDAKALVSTVTKETLIKWNYGECGNITIGSGDGVGVVDNSTAFTRAGGGGIIGFALARKNAIKTVIQTIRDSKVPYNIAMSQVPGTKEQLPETYLTPLIPIANAYNTAMNNAALKLINEADGGSRDLVARMARQGGWWDSGSFWLTISALNLQVERLAAAVPTCNMKSFGDPDYNRSKQSDFKNFMAYRMMDINAAIALEIGTSTNASILAAGHGALYSDTKGDTTGFWETLDRKSAELQERVLNSISLGIISNGSTPTQFNMATLIDPIHGLQTFGSTILVAGEGLWVSANAISFVAGSSKIDYGAGFVITIAVLLIGIGFGFTWLLPMQPFIRVVFIICGWMVAICEGIVLAPILALTFIKFEGTTLIADAQRTGMQLLYNIFFRPPIAMFGLMFIYPMQGIMITFIHTKFAAVVCGAVYGGHVGNVLGLVFSLATIFVLDLMVNNRLFALGDELPDKVNTMFGMSADSRQDSMKANEFVHALETSALIRSMQGGGGAAGARLGGQGGGKPEAGENSITQGQDKAA